METLIQHPIRSVLIANRGEIASRVIRTCKQMGISTVAVFSDADRDAKFVQEADQAIHIGSSEAAQSYLDQDKIIAAAKRAGADAIHPGYGFLSENATFAQKCECEGLVFIGPHAEAIAAMGSKSEAKQIMEDADVPVVPGYKGSDQSEKKLIAEAKQIGFPLLLKATAGGGGKGMRIVHEANELPDAIAAAKREAKSAFGDDELLIEKYIASGRHIEFQIFGDQHGHAIHLLERECTIQRRYQKVVEESPSPVISEDLRERMGAAAVKAAKALHYDNAGTVEFIYDEQSGEFYFLEVNTRLQVEHPVTECVTGLDLVRMQLESAMGLPLQLKQEDVQGSGYAIEVRLYAEDPTNDFLPATGTVHQFSYPEVEGLRMESAIQAGDEISIFYDPMIAKIIVWDRTREAAHAKLDYVLKHTICQGTKTNLRFLKHLIEHPEVQAGNYDTHFIENHVNLESIDHLGEFEQHELCIAATLCDWKRREDQRKLLRSIPSGWRNNFYQPQQVVFELNGERLAASYRFRESRFTFTIGATEYVARIASSNEQSLAISINGLQRTYSVHSEDQRFYVHTPSFGNVQLTKLDRLPQKATEKEVGGYEAPMPSQVIEIKVDSGEQVAEGDALMVISSMKMENTLLASASGTVEEVYVSEGQNVEAGFLLLKINTNSN